LGKERRIRVLNWTDPLGFGVWLYREEMTVGEAAPRVRLRDLVAIGEGRRRRCGGAVADPATRDVWTGFFSVY
jgi:hypothetical protein